MATVLYLNNTQVYPDGKQSIKLVRENPYFTQAESYTLDVTLPMDILENRQFFQNIQRMEKSKQTSVMSCRLAVDNKPLLQGSAKVTQVTEREVKVQLVGGRSEINLLSNESQTYIDEMDYTVRLEDLAYGVLDPSINLTFMPYHDETFEIDGNLWNGGGHNDLGNLNTYQAEAMQPCLVDILEKVIKLMGYTIAENQTDVEPWNCLFIASAKRTKNVAHVLPHWTVIEFVDEYCKFFNCSLIVDEVGKTVRILLNANYFSTARQTTIDPVDEYSVELADEEAHSLRTDNLSFDLSESDCHDYDLIDDTVRDSAPTKDYGSVTEARTAYQAMDADERLRYIFRTPQGLFAGWQHDMKEEDGSDTTLSEFMQMNVFGPLVRNAENGSETTLKIVPVAIAATVLTYYRMDLWGTHYQPGKHPWRYISLANPTGNEYGKWYGIYDESVETEQPTIQEYIEGDADIEKSEKEDRMQVFFVDDVEIPSSSYEGWDKDQFIHAPMPFTDFLYKRMYSQSHRQWSLSLNPSSAKYYLGQLHQNNYTFNMKAKYCVKFLADEIPDPTQVFIIRNKRFACEKIEAQIDDQGLQQLMTGYFYEML